MEAIQKMLTEQTIQVVEKADTWQAAIELASQPLIQSGAIEQRYVETMIENVNKFGPYIVLMPQVAMPHARPEDGVHQMGMSLLITKESVEFEGGKQANLFFVLAATDSSSHLAILSDLSSLLSDSQKVSALLAAHTFAEVSHILSGGAK